MKYLNEANQLLKDSFYESWMDEEDWQEFLDNLKSMSNITAESLSKSIEYGIECGFPIETQLQIVKQVSQVTQKYLNCLVYSLKNQLQN